MSIVQGMCDRARSGENSTLFNGARIVILPRIYSFIDNRLNNYFNISEGEDLVRLHSNIAIGAAAGGAISALGITLHALYNSNFAPCSLLNDLYISNFNHYVLLHALYNSNVDLSLLKVGAVTGFVVGSFLGNEVGIASSDKTKESDYRMKHVASVVLGIAFASLRTLSSHQFYSFCLRSTLKI